MRLFLIVVLIVIASTQNSSCDYSLIGIKQVMGNFNTVAYSPPILQYLASQLNSLQATVLTTYLLCFNKSIIDPCGNYTRNTSNCFNRLYNVSLLDSQYKSSAQIKASIASIGDIVFSAMCDCKEVMFYKGWTNITDDCKNGMPDLDNLLNQYDDDVLIGGTGIKYLNSLLIQTEKQRKYCGFNSLVKASISKRDTCKSVNLEWFNPIADQFETLIYRNDIKNFTDKFYTFYQSLYRAQSLCSNNLTEQITDTHQQ